MLAGPIIAMKFKALHLVFVEPAWRLDLHRGPSAITPISGKRIRGRDNPKCIAATVVNPSNATVGGITRILKLLCGSCPLSDGAIG
jgi:hypothetical protein